MNDSDQFIQRRALAYLELVAADAYSLQVFLQKHAEELPLSPQYLKDFDFRLAGVEVKCKFAVEEIDQTLNQIDSKSGVKTDDKPSRS